MTANQIEYWKLQETKRHNIATEEMDRPLKASQTSSNYASINLMQEQARTQESARASNYASAAASYATAERQYEAAETERTQQGLNLARTEYTNVQTQAETYQLPVDMYAGEVGAVNYNSLHYATPNEMFTLGDIAIWNQALGFSGDALLGNAMKGAIAIFQ